MNKTGVIFDMDGVIVDNDSFHFLSWQSFCKKHGMNIGMEEVKSWFGNKNEEILIRLFGPSLTPSQLNEMAREKEIIYREMYGPVLRETPGLSGFLKELETADAMIALATSAPAENVDFVLKMTGLGKYFRIITDSSMVENGKPHPEIFLKTAERMKIPAADCVVFEDSFHGIRAAKNAGMKVVGVATTHEPELLSETDLVITDFSRIGFADLKKLF